MNMMPGQAPHPMAAPAPPHGPSPLIALLMHHAAAGAPAAPGPHMGGMPPQAAGAPMPLGAGGHAAPKFGHAPAAVPGC